eukprot:UC1_evm1s885
MFQAGRVASSERELKELLTLYDTAVTATDDKIQIVAQAYERLDRVIRYLGIKLKEFGDELNTSSPGITMSLREKSLALEPPERPEPTGLPFPPPSDAAAMKGGGGGGGGRGTGGGTKNSAANASRGRDTSQKGRKRKREAGSGSGGV